ncbi:cytochrome bd-I oxidase subunit CydX [Marinospirillum sp.]|uniref:cytochrome bd-I oxidase subunit CydX n=1 Tax=Marinospirillum sp. TaxID=2183934 RepID=UPI003A8B7091
MWYFAWILGVLLACAFGIINAMWLELNGYAGEEQQEMTEDQHHASGGHSEH